MAGTGRRSGMTVKDDYVLVIGAAGIDIKARPFEPLKSGADNSGAVRNSVGGVARNIAANLAKLDVPAILLSAVGDDVMGKRVLKRTRDFGVNCRHVLRAAGETTGCHVVLQQPNGDLDVAVSDFSVMRHINPDYLFRHRRLFAGARLLVIDANLSDEALEAVFELATRYGV